jgi:hypothetical protein
MELSGFVIDVFEAKALKFGQRLYIDVQREQRIRNLLPANGEL